VLVLIRDLTHEDKIEAIGLAVETALGTDAWLSALVMSPQGFDDLRQRAVTGEHKRVHVSAEVKARRRRLA
jgi:hypothetical protein